MHLSNSVHIRFRRREHDFQRRAFAYRADPHSAEIIQNRIATIARDRFIDGMVDLLAELAGVMIRLSAALFLERGLLPFFEFLRRNSVIHEQFIAVFQHFIFVRLGGWVKFSFFIQVKLQKSEQSSARKVFGNQPRRAAISTDVKNSEKQISPITAASRRLQ